MTSLNANKSYYVTGDLHGQKGRLEQAVELLQPSPDKPLVIPGDFLGGPKPRELVDYMIKLSLKDIVIPTLGNYEWTYVSALSEVFSGDKQSIEKRDIWRNHIMPACLEVDMYRSYGVNTAGTTIKERAKLLGRAMRDLGHFQWLTGLSPYFDASPDFIAVHAGPLRHVPWDKQAAQLNQAWRTDRLSHEPEQLFGGFDGTDLVGLAEVVAVPHEVDTRTFISGHLPVGAGMSRSDKRDGHAERISVDSNLLGGEDLIVVDTAKLLLPDEERIIRIPLAV